MIVRQSLLYRRISAGLRGAVPSVFSGTLVGDTDCRCNEPERMSGDSKVQGRIEFEAAKASSRAHVVDAREKGVG